MTQQELDALNITETVEGYHVKDLVYKKVDNIIRGFVKCPVVGRPTRNDGYIVVTWRVSNGTLTDFYGGKTRPDLYLKINR